jgi:HAE1 family hydrophobic/amphiphilic exporter-1
MRLTDIPVERPVATLMLLVSLVVLGVVSIGRIPLGAQPMIERPMVQVEVPFPGSHPLEALREIAMPIEEEIATIPGVSSLRSDSGASRVEVRVEFDWDDDLDLKKLEVREAVERVRRQLPDGIGWIRVEGRMMGHGGGSILRGRLSSERDLSESWELLDRRIRRPIERVGGVARVELSGVEPQQVRIDIDLDALERHGVSPAALRARLDRENLDMDLGAIRGDRLRYDVRAVGRFDEVDEIRALQIAEGVRLADVARVSFEEPRLQYGRHLNGKFAIGIEVYQEPTANTVETVDKIMARIEEIRADPQLQGISLLVWNNSAEQIRSSLAGLRNAGLIGAVFAVIILYGFLRRITTTLIVMVAIPFSLIVTSGVMYLIGMEFNIFTLLGLMLGVGMLVDNAVVVIENIHRREAQGMAPREASQVGVREVFLAVVAATATTIIVWSWLFVAETSEMTIIMGATAGVICLAVACSLLVSVTFIPLATSRLAPREPGQPGFLLRRLLPAYRSTLAWTLRHRFIGLATLFLLAGSMYIPALHIEWSPEPRSQEPGLTINYQIHDSATKEVLEGYVDEVEAWLETKREELGFEHVYSFYSEEWRTLTQVYLPEDAATPENLARLRRGLQADLPVIPGVKLEIGDRMWWRGGRAGRTMVAVALRGEDPEYLEEIAREVERRLKPIEDVVEVWGPTLRGQQEVRLMVDPERAEAYGLSPREIARAVGFAFRGQMLRRFEGDWGEIEMRLGLPEDAQPGLEALRVLPVPRPGRDDVPLGVVADIELARTPNEIDRADRAITQWVSAQFADDTVTTAEGQKRVAAAMAGLALPEGYSWDWSEWGRNRDEAFGTMGYGVLVSLLVVLLLMAALFESLTQPLAILITLPLAFSGVLWSLWLLGYTFDIVAFVGVIILIGIVVNNGIVMVDHVNALRRSGRPRVEALIEGCGDRMRPVLMTAITTICGLIPLAVSSSTIGGDVVLDSLAVAMIGGLLSSTILTLVALPVWYTTIEDIGAMVARTLPRRRPVPVEA